MPQDYISYILAYFISSKESETTKEDLSQWCVLTVIVGSAAIKPEIRRTAAYSVGL